MRLWDWLKEFFDDRQAAPIGRGTRSEQGVALVLLLNEPRVLDAGLLADLASEALGEHFSAGEEEANERFVAGELPSFVLKHGERVFLVNCFARPYLDDPEEAARAISELRLRKAVREHSAWLSVDLLGDCAPEQRPEAYCNIGKLIAALADEDCLAIFAPATSQLIVYDAEMRQQLCSRDPLDLFEQSAHPPVVPVSGNDPRLKAAVAKARRRWPAFVHAFEERQPEQSFSVKARIGDDDCFEFMWLTVTGLENGIIYGQLDNDPIELTSIRCGDRVRVRVKDLNDWLFTDGEEMHGGYTIEVLRKIQEELQQE
jgi:uncharacterized protein YegJ (DUF2314 family)